MARPDGFRLSPGSLSLLRAKAAAFGTQQELADAAKMPKPTLQKLLAGDADPSFSRVAALAKVLKLSLDDVANAPMGAVDFGGASFAKAVERAAGPSISEAMANAIGGWEKPFRQLLQQSTPDQIAEIFRRELSRPIDELGAGLNGRNSSNSTHELMMPIPALPVPASAGDGSIVATEQLKDGPFHCAEDWLRREFGSIRDLRLVQIKGASQEPDLHEGDWVLIDESKTGLETGLAVIRLDDCIMIKWLEREGRKVHLKSRNPRYGTTTIDLSEEEGRLQIIGRAVYCFKSI